MLYPAMSMESLQVLRHEGSEGVIELAYHIEGAALEDQNGLVRSRTLNISQYADFLIDGHPSTRCGLLKLNRKCSIDATSINETQKA